MSKLPGMGKLKQLNAARKLARDPEALQAMMGGQMPPGGLPGMDALAGLGAGAPPAPLSRKQASQKKNKRKNAKNARKKNRRK